MLLFASLICAGVILGPASFSQLAESLPEALTQHKAYERVLAHVADFVDPKVTHAFTFFFGLIK